MDTDKHYVLGFAFNVSKKRVILIRKTKPEWQAGLFNGVGGKIERGELPVEAMVREFQEETSVETSPEQWKSFHLMASGKASTPYTTVHCFHAVLTTHQWRSAKTTTDEEVVVAQINHLQDVIPNLRWLIPLALDNSTVTSTSLFRTIKLEVVTHGLSKIEKGQIDPPPLRNYPCSKCAGDPMYTRKPCGGMATPKYEHRIECSECGHNNKKWFSQRHHAILDWKNREPYMPL